VPEPPHPGLAWIAQLRGGADWLERLPRLVEGCRERWSLTLGEPYAYAFASLALPADLPDGTPAVLKVQFPDRESEHEADALRRWDGDGAVRLLDHDHERRALLLERAEPGTHLSAAGPDVALEVLLGLVPRLWLPAQDPFTTLLVEAAWWSEEMMSARNGEHPYPRAFLDLALDLLGWLPSTQGEQVLVHQDLHGDNVVAATREPWLAIDPKPLVGERAFALAPIVRSSELGHSPDAVVGRLDRLSDAFGVDRERARLWTIAQTVAWADRDDPDPVHLEVVRWLIEAA
jgi:streptomycin 6-kinase